MPVVGFLTCNGSGIFCRPKLMYRGRLDTELISHLHRSSTTYSSGADPSPANNSCTSFEYVHINLITITFDFPSTCSPSTKNTSTLSVSHDLYSKMCSILPSVVYKFL